MPPLSSTAWSWLLTDVMREARWLRPSAPIPGGLVWSLKDSAVLSSRTTATDLVPYMDPGPCQEYSQIRWHIGHCLNKEDTQINEHASYSWEKPLPYWMCAELAPYYINLPGKWDLKSVMGKKARRPTQVLHVQWKLVSQEPQTTWAIGLGSLCSFCSCLVLSHSCIHAASNPLQPTSPLWFFKTTHLLAFCCLFIWSNLSNTSVVVNTCHIPV